MAVSSLSFFISNMIETISFARLVHVAKMKSPLPLRRRCPFSSTRGNAVARMQLTPSRSAAPASRPPSWSKGAPSSSPEARNLAITVAQLQRVLLLDGGFLRLLFTTTRFGSFFSSSRSRATTVTASVTASLRATSAASSCDLSC